MSYWITKNLGKWFHLCALLIVHWRNRACCTAVRHLLHIRESMPGKRRKSFVSNFNYSVCMNTFCHTICCIYVQLSRQCWETHDIVIITAIWSHESHIFSVLQEAMKRILKQKSHPYEEYNKSYKVIKSHIFKKSYFFSYAYFRW